jgi:hypothetical protein
MSWFPSGLEPVEDLGPAAWVSESLTNWPGAGRSSVKHLVPPSFEAYARVLHQPRSPRGSGETGTWKRRALELHRELGAEMSWWDLLGTAPFAGPSDPLMPEIGRLNAVEVDSLAELLGRHTPDPGTCWFGLWEGFGFLHPGGASYLRAPETIRDRLANLAVRRAERKADRETERAFRRLRRFSLYGGGRSYLLIAGTVADASRFRFTSWLQSPTLWWSDDRAWFVHTEIDAMSTYIGGSRLLVDELVGQQILESFEVEEETPAVL